VLQGTERFWKGITKTQNLSKHPEEVIAKESRNMLDALGCVRLVWDTKIKNKKIKSYWYY
jgi:hypothetical protein